MAFAAPWPVSPVSINGMRTQTILSDLKGGRVFNREMTMTDSQRLLAEYVATGSEPAFRELVRRYLDLVYSAAYRLMDRDGHLAEDIAQTVFADLARKARTLSGEVMLGGWLHRHTCYVAANLRRSERRRLNRERQAVAMNAFPDHSEANLAQIAPVLDEAIDQLGADDRQAVLLRFFEQRDFRSIGEALGSNEDAAQKRVTLLSPPPPWPPRSRPEWSAPRRRDSQSVFPARPSPRRQPDPP
jgi:RNA polymerase sigma factor (sigma-70 family)